MTNTATPFARPLYVMLKPTGAACNLRCKYCYYLEKSSLYKDSGPHVMPDEVLEKFTEQYINAQTMPQVLFTWHGGEPLLRPLSFYRKAVRMQKKYAQGKLIANSIQTNGTLLTDEWCEFLAENNWLVGISIDGPQEYHDAYRLSVGGHPSWRKVMDGIRLLNKYGVEWNAMAVVNDRNVGHPLEFYHFFKDIGCRYLQFTPVVERNFLSVTHDQWGSFLIDIFDEWVHHDVGEMFVEIFDCMLANWMGQSPGICIYNKECGHAGVMEYNGDVYSCDHFVFPEYKLGNINDNALIEMLYGERQKTFSTLKHQSLPRQCLECEFEFACHGECPKNRFMRDQYGNPGLNYLCQGYYNFLKHSAPYFDFMRNELVHGRAPANVMKANYC